MAKSKRKRRGAAENDEGSALSWLIGSSGPVSEDYGGHGPPSKTIAASCSRSTPCGLAAPRLLTTTPLETLLDEIGKTLSPRVRCVMALKNQGAGFPDSGLFTADQLGRAADDVALLDRIPASGVIDAEGTGAITLEEADSEQVCRYWK